MENIVRKHVFWNIWWCNSWGGGGGNVTVVVAFFFNMLLVSILVALSRLLSKHFSTAGKR